MLKPFKSFLTYLQKNTNGGNIFGLTPNGNDDEQQETDEGGDPCQEILIDPLDDPLNSSTELFTIDPLALDESGIDPTGFNTSVEEGSTEGEIIIVDVNALTKRNGGNVSAPLSRTFNDSNVAEDDADEEDEDPSYETVKNIIEPQTIMTTNDESHEERSDGSDSGIGPETASELLTSIDERNNTASDIFNLTDASTSTTLTAAASLPPPRSSLKRRSADTVGDLTDMPKRQKRSITFDGGVTVYYFPRIQGFACVPSQGGCTLGMGAHHIHSRKFSMAEHAAEQRRVHRQQLNELNPRGSSSDESDSDEEISESGSEIDTETNGFLQPVTTRQRRALLKAAGVRKIDTGEKDECRVIRSSREFCGCNCRGYCDPDTCFCSQSGIKCQVDRPNFPCGCTRDGCGNVIGRVEFNPGRVRTHFIHTIMRMELENKQQGGGGVNVIGVGSINGSDEIDMNCDTTTSRQWLPHIRMPDYTQHASVYSNSTPPLTTPDPTTSSNHMDLQYVYRDDYGSIMDNRLTHQSLYQNQYSTQSPSPAAIHFNQTLDYNVVDPVVVMPTNQHIRFDDATDSLPQPLPSEPPPSSTYLHSSTLPAIATIQSTISPTSNTSLPATAYHHQHCSNISNSNENHRNLSSSQSNDDCFETGPTGFISLHPPESNSPRLDAINDLLHNNRFSPLMATTEYPLHVDRIENNSNSSSPPPPSTTLPTSSLSSSSNDNLDLDDGFDKNNFKSLVTIDKLNNDIQLLNNNCDVKLMGDQRNAFIGGIDGNRDSVAVVGGGGGSAKVGNENLCEIIKKSIVETVST